MFRGVLLVLAISLLIGCDKSSSTPGVAWIADDDPKMTAAIEEARRTAPTFTAALRTPKSRQSGFSVKMPFTDGANTEHMWVTPVTFDGKKFNGVVNNAPERLTNVKIGDQASANQSEISDWMFVDDGKLVGGYTLRVLRDSLPDDERAEFDGSLPFVIE